MNSPIPRLFLILILTFPALRAHAQQEAYIFALGDPDVFRGMVYYSVEQDGVLDGGLMLDADPALRNPETATPRERTETLAGTYDVEGAVLGKRFAGALVLELLAGNPRSGVYRLTWDQDPAGLGFHLGSALIGGFPSEQGGTITLKRGEPIVLSMVNVHDGAMSSQELVLDGSELEGEHRATDRKAPDAPATIVSFRRDGAIYRMTMPDGRIGIALPLDLAGE